MTPAADAVGAASSSAGISAQSLALVPARARGGSGGNWGELMAGRRAEEAAAVAAAVGEESAEVVMGILWKWVNLGRGWGMRLFVLEGVSTRSGDGDDASTTFDEDEEEDDEEDDEEEAEGEEEEAGGDQEADSSAVTSSGHGLLKRSGSDLRSRQIGSSGRRSGRARSKARRAAKADVLARDNDEDEGGSGSSGGQDDEFFEAMDDFVSSGSVLTVLDIQEVGFTYPKIPRRERLPPPAEEEKPVSIWSILKDLVGKDLFKVSLPVSFNEPISTNQKYCETYEYSWLLDRAAEYGRRGNKLMRAVHVAAFAVSRYSGNAGRMHKPFNPLLGETFEADCPDKGFRYVSEAVLHYPPTLAWNCEGTGWRSWGDACLKVRFWGPSVQLDPVGVLSVAFDDGEVFEWSNVTVSIQNLILGKPFVDHYGTMRIRGNRGFSARLRFKERSTFDRNPHQVRGIVQSDDGEEKATLVGRWDQFLHFVPGELSSKSQKEESEVLATAQLLWQKCAPSPFPCKYKFTPFCITLNEMTPGLKYSKFTPFRITPNELTLGLKVTHLLGAPPSDRFLSAAGLAGLGGGDVSVRRLTICFLSSLRFPSQEHLPPTDSRLREDQRALEEGYYDRAIQEKSRLEQKQRKVRGGLSVLGVLVYGCAWRHEEREHVVWEVVWNRGSESRQAGVAPAMVPTARGTKEHADLRGGIQALILIILSPHIPASSFSLQALKAGEPGWHPRWFQQQGGPGSTWTYVGGYWERRGAHDWSGIKDLFADDEEENRQKEQRGKEQREKEQQEKEQREKEQKEKEQKEKEKRERELKEKEQKEKEQKEKKQREKEQQEQEEEPEEEQEGQEEEQEGQEEEQEEEQEWQEEQEGQEEEQEGQEEEQEGQEEEQEGQEEEQEGQEEEQEGQE
ncbi:unnamed protein product [Closterium sp. Naga37s-1]|nr:unnamed protein product [Closterium sp. Naga37s-1]